MTGGYTQTGGAKLHVTQDDFGFWMLSVEHSDGTMELLAFLFPSADHLIGDGQELIAKNRYPNATLLVDAPRFAADDLARLSQADYQRPEPRKVRNS